MKSSRAAIAESGFTLIEAMISMFFIAFIVGEMAMVSNHGRRTSAHARRLSEANMLADGLLEQTRNTAYKNLDAPFSTVNNPQNPVKFDLTRDGVVESYNETCTSSGNVTTCVCTPDPSSAVTGDEYTVTRTVTPFLPSAAALFDSSTAVDIDVLVAWKDHAGAPRQLRVSTVRTVF